MTSRAPKLFRIGAVLVLVVTLAAVVASAVLRVFDFSHPGDYGEGPVLAMACRVAEQSISSEWLEQPPYTLTCYGPGYYWAVASVSAILPWHDTLIPGRLVSLAATLATAALLGLAIGRSTRSIEATLAAALIFLASPIVHAWGIPHRVDSLAMLFAVGAYLAVGNRRYGVAMSAVCIVVGSLVKQTVALAAVPIFLYLLLSKRYKEAAVFILAVAVPGALAWIVLDRLSGGYFLAASIRGNLGTMFPAQGFWAGYTFLATPLGVVAGLLVGWQFVRRGGMVMSDQGSLWCLAFVLSTSIASILSAKEGAAANYFLEPSALGALVIGQYGVGRLLRPIRVRALVMVVLIAFLLAAPDVQIIRERGLRLDREPFGEAVVAEQLGAGDGTWVLADGQLVPAVLHCGYTPAVNDPFVFRLLAEQGQLDQTRLIEAIGRGDVAWLVLKQSLATHREHIGRTSQKWPASVLDAMGECYTLAASADQVYIYRCQTTGIQDNSP